VYAVCGAVWVVCMCVFVCVSCVYHAVQIKAVTNVVCVCVCVFVCVLCVCVLCACVWCGMGMVVLHSFVCVCVCVCIHALKPHTQIVTPHTHIQRVPMYTHTYATHTRTHTLTHTHTHTYPHTIPCARKQTCKHAIRTPKSQANTHTRKLLGCAYWRSTSKPRTTPVRNLKGEACD